MIGPVRRIAAGVVGWAICAFARALTGARALWKGCAPVPEQRIYYGNHTSHGDFVLIYASLPPLLRHATRPVAGSDYWDTSALRRFVIHDVFDGVTLDRTRATPGEDPVAIMAAALDRGASLILFPEGTRNTTDEPLLPFKSGLWHLASRRPDVPAVPVWIENLNRVMPKGAAIPVPLLCTLTFGVPVRIAAGEPKDAYLGRARDALAALCPPRE